MKRNVARKAPSRWSDLRRSGAKGAAVLLALGLFASCAESTPPEDEEADEARGEQGDEPLAQAGAPSRSVLQQALDELRRNRPPADPSTTDTMLEYAKKCDAATGITVPAFSCEDGSTVPNQGDKPAYTGAKCDRPNVLNGQCDPGFISDSIPIECFSFGRGTRGACQRV